MASAKISTFQWIILLGIFLLAPAIGAGIGYLSPHEMRAQATKMLHRVLHLPQGTSSSTGVNKDYLTITNADGEIICADGQQHEVPCWRMRMEQGLVKDVSGPYTPAAPEQLYGVLEERTGPNGTIMSLGKKNDLTDQEPPSSGKSKKSSGSRLSSAQQALTD